MRVVVSDNDSHIPGSSLKCIECGSIFKGSPRLYKCPKCGGLLEVILHNKEWKPRGRGVWRYKDMLPRIDIRPVTISEGSTPLIPSTLDENLYIKFEGSNPTGSFKDRGMTVATSIAVSSGTKILIAASTGNTSASVAAYAARASMPTVIVLPKDKVALGKIVQAVGYGARIVWVKGSFDDAMRIVMDIVKTSEEFYPMNSFNPWRLEGQKTIIFELVEELEKIDNIIYPVGNGGNISSAYKALRELLEIGIITKYPRLFGVQAVGAAPLADMIEKGMDTPPFYDSPETIATAIRIGHPVNWRKVVNAIKSTRGTIVKVSDKQIIEAQKLLARKEGVLAEPAGAASLAGYLVLKEKGIIKKGETSVIIVTGHGLKDPDSIERMEYKWIDVEPTIESTRLKDIILEHLV